ncbi:MAG: tetratricopeptide repeat protein [Chitinispirillales bacterium]|jgi:tetratricopeptide (TPR) repeat protein|nr:tetratricopeptide repeat protein [Chitinispirillales bacterium]
MKTKKNAGFLRVLFVALLLLSVCAIGQEGAGDGGGGYDAPYFQADFTQDLNSWTSALVNPALLYRVNQLHASMAFYRWGLDRGNMGYQDFGLYYPVRLNHTVGLTLLHTRNSMERAVPDAGSDGYRELGMVSFQDLWIVGNYSYRFFPWFVAGANLKLRSQIQFGETSLSKVPGLDMGLYFNPIDHYRFGDLGVSIALLDIMPTQTPWNAAAVAAIAGSDNDNLVTSSRARFGIRYSGLNDNLVTSFEMILDNAMQFIHDNINWMKSDMARLKDEVKNNPGNYPTGFSISSPPIVPRWGFHAKYMFIPQIWFKGGWTNNNIPYLGFNYNFIYPLPEMINYFNLDYHFGYSFVEKAQGTLKDERGMVMMLRLSADMGKTREQKESKRLYDRLVVAPMDTYQEAMRLFYAGRYWEAVFAYGKLMALYPTFYLNDKAVYYMGESYRHLYMNETAREVFKEAMEEYSTSDMRAHYLYGLMNVDYREELYDEALRNYAFIINLYEDSEIVGEAHYLAGQIAFMRDNHEEAKRLLDLVKTTDPSYKNAQYTLSVINLQSDRMQAAIQNLLIVIHDTSSRTEDVMLQHAAALKLGHLYFEAGDKLREAVEAYGRVPDNADPYGDEALLGSAWAWIKAGQAQLAWQRADRIISLHPQSPLVPEAQLLKGYSLMLQKRFPEAIITLERCLAATEKAYLTENDVRTRKVQFDEANDAFGPTADRIKRNASRKPSQRTLEERPGLQREYEVFAKENKEFFDYKVMQKSHTRFFMRKDEIVDDATYALAKATNYVKSRGSSRTLDGMRSEQERLEEEIERLRQELEAEGQ